jgi:U3 small nucleolar RNA-associated protein 10
LTSSFSSAVVTAFSKWDGGVDGEVEEEDKDAKNVLTSMRSILDALRRIHPRGVDEGVADAVFGTHQGKHRKARRKQMALLLGVRSTKQLPRNSDVNNEGNPISQDDNDDYALATGNLLPPRVALEHSDANIRHKAVHRTVQEAKDGVAPHGGDTLEEALLRRFWVDDHVQVALEAAKALCGLMQARSSARPFSEKFAEMSLSALYRWTSFEANNHDSNHQVDLVGLALKLVGYSIAPCSTLMLSDSALCKVQCCFEAIVANMEESLHTHVRDCALEALELATGANSAEDQTIAADKMIFSNATALNGLKKLCDSKSLNSYLGTGEKILEIALRKRYIWVVLQLLSNSLGIDKDASLADIAFDCCLLLLKEVDSGDLESKQSKTLRKCLDACVDIKSKTDKKSVPSVLVLIAASSDGDVVYEAVCTNAMKVACSHVVDKGSNPVPSVVVILEAVLRPETPSVAIERLLSLVQPQTSSHEAAVVPLLALLAHPEQRVRSCAQKTISRLSGSMDGGPVSAFFMAVSTCKSSVVMDGAPALPKLLATAVRGARHKTKAAEFLLTRCVVAASSLASDNQSSDSEWLSLQDAYGGNRSASIVLSACELAGEQSFPLAMRWKYAGEHLFNLLWRAKDDRETPITLMPLIETVVRMLKGVVVDELSAATEASSIIISSGPSASGTRARSYSVGKIEGVTFIKTFPKSMGQAIRDSLAAVGNDNNASPTSQQLVRVIIEETLGRESWGTGVFSKLEPSLQQQLALNLLSNADGDIGDVAVFALRCLPIQSRDLAYLLSHLRRKNESLSKVTLIAEVVQSRAPVLFDSIHCLEVTTALFELLTYLSSDTADFRDADGLEFARHSLLFALQEILELVAKRVDNATKISTNKDQLVDQARSLVHLLGRKTVLGSRPLVSQKARSTAIAVLATTCSLLPPDSVLTLLVSTMSMLVTDAGKQLDSLKLAIDFLSVVVPVYCQLAVTASLSLGHLFNEFIAAITIVKDEGARIELFGCLVRAIHSTSAFDGENTPCGALLAVFLVSELAENNVKKVVETGFVASILAQHFSPIAQLSAVEELVHIVNAFLTLLSGRNQTTKMPRRSPLSLPFQEIEFIAGWGDEENQNITIKPEQTVKILKLSCWILSSVTEALSNWNLRKAIKNRVGSASKMCLRLWQDLLLLQSTLEGNQVGLQGTKSERELCTKLADETLKMLQGILPADVFLAAVSTLMVDDVTEELQARSLRLVADRVSGLDASSAEASLFLEQIPRFVEVMDRAKGYPVVQSALIATEKMARLLRLGSEKIHVNANEINDFVLALERASAILEKHSISLTEMDLMSEDDFHGQLVSSAALACATFVRVVTIRCLPVLPKMVKSLLTALASANSFLALNASIPVESRAIASMVQISIVRAFAALCDVVPQFLGPYLKELLSPRTLLSGSLHLVGKVRDIGVKTETELLLSTVARRIPCRQLVPCVAQSISQCHHMNEVCNLISLLTKSIDLSTQADATSQKRNLFRSLTLVYDFECDERDHVLNVANELLLGFVLKLSEIQLLSLYAQFRDWRGQLDSSNTEANAGRRYAFWRLSEVLTNQLKSLFLPCLSTATGDAIEELVSRRRLPWIVLHLPPNGFSTFVKEICAKSLCLPRRAQKGHSGKKKRRLDSEDGVESNAAYGVKSLQSLRPLLGCLESALKADARDGGKWVRVDDGHRYNTLLEPLGKLLQCRLTPELQEPSTSRCDNFHRLVIGTESEGSSVVNCLTALAAAAGNEQLWKPLNHHILEACGNENRSEVRKAGISCLLKVIRTIGDEYMVLLPECLPVLSELLEDADEDIVTLAQECVAVGEELLGESLQDSLR